MGYSERTIHDLNRLIDIHLDTVDILAYALAGPVSATLGRTVRAMQDDHASAAALLERRVLALSGQPVSSRARHHSVRPSVPEAEQGIDDLCVLLALRANEWASIAGYCTVDTVTEEGHVERRRGLEMDARHLLLLSAMLRERGAAADQDKVIRMLRDAAVELRQTLDLGGTTLDTPRMVTEAGGPRAPSARVTPR